MEVKKMCMCLYIGSDKELPLIPWNDNIKPNIFVLELNDDEKDVQKQFSKPFVYYIGSSEGCGCGFKYGINEIEDEEDKKRDIAGRKSIEELFKYLRENIKDVNDFELYSCWEGDQGSNPVFRKELHLSKFIIGKEFSFKEKQFILIKK